MLRVLLTAMAALFLIGAAPVMAPGTEADRAPDWLIKPDGALVARFYPIKAQREGVEGGATILCVVGLDTRLNSCRVVFEDPPGYGFGAAALDIAGEMRMAPTIRNGLPQESSVRVPLVFRMPESPPTAPPSTALFFAVAGGFLLLALLLLTGLILAYRAFGRPE
jgi:TonB family protein